MAFQAVPDTAQAFIHGTMNGQAVGMTFNFRKTGGYAEQDIIDLADDVDNWYATEMLPNLSSLYTYEYTVVRGLANEEDYEVQNNDGAGVGGQAGLIVSNNVTWAAKRITGFTGRSSRGRVYIPGLRVSNLTSNANTLTVGTIVAILSALAEIATYALTHGWVEVIVSRWHNNMKRVVATTQTVSDWTFTDDTVDSQRRRLH